VKAEKQRDVWEEIEQRLGSVGRLKILRVMLEKPNDAFTKYALEKATKLKPVDARTNIGVLVEIGWVKEYPYQPTTYKINLDNELVKHISRFFQEIRYL
jgi:Fic family protein